MMPAAKYVLPTLALLAVKFSSPAQELSGPVSDTPPHALDAAAAAGDKPKPVKSDDDMGGRIPVQFGLTLGGYYDDNIYAQPRGPDRMGDFIWNVAPSVSWNSMPVTGAENSFQLSYSPEFIFYQNHPRNNTVEQAGSFVYAFHGARTDLLVSQQYASVQNNSPDLGDLVKFEEYLTTVNLDYQMTGKLGLTLRAQQDITSYDQGFDSTEWSGSAYLNYEALPKTSFGLGGLFGAADLAGPNQLFEQINGRVLYNPTAKLSFNATGGLEFRQTQGSGSSRMTPTFSLGLDYDPFAGTDVILNAYRNFAYSAKFYGDDYLTTGVSGSISQRLFQKLYLSVSASFENAVYEDNFTDGSSDLGYDYFSVRPALAYNPTEWCMVSVFYQYRQNISHTIDPFTDNEVGFESRFTY